MRMVPSAAQALQRERDAPAQVGVGRDDGPSPLGGSDHGVRARAAQAQGRVGAAERVDARRVGDRAPVVRRRGRGPPAQVQDVRQQRPRGARALRARPAGRPWAGTPARARPARRRGSPRGPSPGRPAGGRAPRRSGAAPGRAASPAPGRPAGAGPAPAPRRGRRRTPAPAAGPTRGTPARRTRTAPSRGPAARSARAPRGARRPPAAAPGASATRASTSSSSRGQLEGHQASPVVEPGERGTPRRVDQVQALEQVEAECVAHGRDASARTRRWTEGSGDHYSGRANRPRPAARSPGAPA